MWSFSIHLIFLPSPIELHNARREGCDFQKNEQAAVTRRDWTCLNRKEGRGRYKLPGAYCSNYCWSRRASSCYFFQKSDFSVLTLNKGMKLSTVFNVSTRIERSVPQFMFICTQTHKSAYVSFPSHLKSIIYSYKLQFNSYNYDIYVIQPCFVALYLTNVSPPPRAQHNSAECNWVSLFSLPPLGGLRHLWHLCIKSNLPPTSCHDIIISDQLPIMLQQVASHLQNVWEGRVESHGWTGRLHFSIDMRGKVADRCSNEGLCKVIVQPESCRPSWSPQRSHGPARH